MTKTFFKLVACCVVLTMVLSNCHKASQDNQCISYGTPNVASVSGSDSGLVNQPVDFNVVYGGCGCGQFDHFGQTIDSDTVTVSVNLK